MLTIKLIKLIKLATHESSLEYSEANIGAEAAELHFLSVLTTAANDRLCRFRFLVLKQRYSMNLNQQYFQS